jgi:hypothetical protein
MLLSVGLTLQTIARITGLAVPTSHLALFAVLASLALLALTFLASLLPAAEHRLSNCQH